jgi:hypothetical protein
MEEKAEVFEMDGIFYKIQQDKYEPREVYIGRVWFILGVIKGNEKMIHDKIEFNKLLTKSRVESNKKHLGCNYN